MQLPALTYGFTSGHPGSTRLLIDTAAAHREESDAVESLLRTTTAIAGGTQAGTAERMLAALLGDFPRELLEDLTTYASAASAGHGRTLLVHGVTRISERDYADIAEVLWPEAGGAGPQVLRRLLLRRLDARPVDHELSWPAVFGRHRELRVRVGDHDGALYYALAGGDLPAVVDAVTRWTLSYEARTWLDRLSAVTAAPRRRTPSGESPRSQLRKLAREAGDADLTRLVAGLWIAGDPLIGGQREALHRQIAADFEAAARTYPDDDVEPLLRAARRHRRIAEDWT
jgi:hypothetical protein